MPPNYYRSYLLRMWKEYQDEDYRASLQDTITSECHNFPSLAAMLAFLRSKNEPSDFKVKQPFDVEIRE